jgi:hypothetical protein
VSRRLSIFVDESGDFGSYEPHSPYYLVAMLFHDQSVDISRPVESLDKHIDNLGFAAHAIHTGPLIRREETYINFSIDERKKLLNALLHFCHHVDIKYTLLQVNKRDCKDGLEIVGNLARQIQNAVNANREYLQSFDEIIVYYDNGQMELSRVLTSTLSVLLSKVSFRKVMPSGYKLFQLADMFCSLELVDIKFSSGTDSKSEKEFFKNKRTFRKNYLDSIRKKRFMQP